MFLKGKDELMAGCSFVAVLQLQNGKSKQELLPSQVCCIIHFHKFYKYKSCLTWIACAIFRYTHRKGIQGQQSLKAGKLFTSLLFIRTRLGVLEAISS